MKVISLALFMIRKNMKQSIIFGLTLVLTLTIHLVFANLISNPFLLGTNRVRGIDHPLGSNFPLSMGLPFLIIVFCWFIILYASQYYRIQKNKELSILMMWGFNLKNFIEYWYKWELFLWLLFPWLYCWEQLWYSWWIISYTVIWWLITQYLRLFFLFTWFQL